jgi:nucleoside-diphosphate-sugar epimerase
MKVVVTGAAGLQGNPLCIALADAGHEVVAIDSLTRGTRIPLHPNIQFFAMNCNEVNLFAKVAEGVHTMFHLASNLAGHAEMAADKIKFFDDNIRTDMAVITVCERVGVRQIVYASSACRYPAERWQIGWNHTVTESDYFPMSPGSRPNPDCNYGLAKAIGEAMVTAARVEKKVVLRLFNVYGPHGQLGQVVPDLIARAVETERNGGGTLEVKGNPRNGASLLYVSDAVEAYMATLTPPYPLESPTILNIGSPFIVDMMQVAREIAEVSEGFLNISFPDMPGLSKLSVVGKNADITKAREVLGWEPRRALRDGLRETAAAYTSSIGISVKNESKI